MGVFRPGGFALTDRAMEFVQPLEGKAVLDVGCGDGETIEYIAEKYGASVQGIDRSKALIEKGLARNPALMVREGNAEYLDFPSFTFDAVLMECVLSVVDLQEEAVHEAYCVLKPGGKLVISDLFLIDPDPEEVEEALQAAHAWKYRQHTPGDCDEEQKGPSGYAIDGAFMKERLYDLIREGGMEVELWEDRSEDLASFAASAIMECGSVEGYFAAKRPEGEPPEAFCTADLRRKLGYFLLIAKKPEAV